MAMVKPIPFQIRFLPTAPTLYAIAVPSQYPLHVGGPEASLAGLVLFDTSEKRHALVARLRGLLDSE